MDMHMPSSSPFTYLVGEHARAIVAIQDLQREVQSLLSFREHVLAAFPHLHLRDQTQTRPRPAPQTPGGKSLSEGPPTVADSGFSTDKASTSMGKSSSSSGELSGGTRWSTGDTEVPTPLGSAEDELLTLLDVIEKKGNRLRQDLEKAEERERELGPVSDPGAEGGSTSPPVEKWKTPSTPDWWPHSLPGAGPRLDFLPGLEAWGEVERLRVDRMYLLGRLQRAEAEGGAAHQRLLDLHGQLVSLAAEKKRLEEAFRSALKGTDHPGIGPSKGFRGVTVSVNSTSTPKSPIAGSDDIFLPRVLKVPIKDKWGSKPPSKIPQAPKRDQGAFLSHSKTLVNVSSMSPKDSVNLGASSAASTSKSASIDSSLRGNHVVIERERRTNRVDGGLSMPASLLKEARMKVKPDKQRISAILKEKDVLALQKQLLTTVMETEVLKRQIEVASDEWENRLTEVEKERRRNDELKAENASLLKECSLMKKETPTTDASVHARPVSHSIGVGTNDEEDKPTHSVHQGPNVKYDVVVYEEKYPKPAWPRPSNMRKQAPVEKPPRRPRPVSVGPSSGVTSFGRDSLGRFTKVPLRASARTPPATPRTSPASSISLYRSPGARTPTQESPRVMSPNVKGSVGRRDSLKYAMGSAQPAPSTPGAKGTSQHKGGSWMSKTEGRLKKRNHVTGAKSGRHGNGDVVDAGLESVSGDFFDSISDSVVSPGRADTPPILEKLDPASKLWHPVYSNALSLSRVYSPVNPGWWRGRDPPPPKDSLEINGELSQGSDTPSPSISTKTPRFNKSSYKAFRRNYPSGVLRLRKAPDRPSVLPQDIHSSVVSQASDRV